jgi:serine/threonine-protein kinase
VVVGGRYRLRSPLGSGAMGEVWRAEHVSLGTPVAVKLVDTAKHQDAAEILARFQTEARAAAQLRSPHVVQILDHGAEGRVAFIAMELLEGESLEQRLERRGHLLPAEAAHVLREIARGLDRAHAAGVVHRDLKPSNVFLARVDDAEVVKILDFGIAKLLAAPAGQQVQTQAGYVMGTPAYMSPEQVLGQPVTPRSDLWQLAVIAFECVTGHRPFDGQTLGQLFMAICTAELPVPSARMLKPGAPVPPALAAFDAWFARAASRDPAQRFASAGAMAEALATTFAPGGAGEAAVPTFVSPRVEPPFPMATGRSAAWSTGRAEPPARRAVPPSVIAGLALAPLVALVVGGLVYWQTHRASIVAAASTTSAASASAPTPLPPPPPAPPASASAPPAASASAPRPHATTAPRPPPSVTPRGKPTSGDRIGL